MGSHGSALKCRHNERDGVSNHRRVDCLPNRLFRRRSKKTSKLCVTGLCAGNSLVTDEFPAQRASNAEDVSIWWRQHCLLGSGLSTTGTTHSFIFKTPNVTPNDILILIFNTGYLDMCHARQVSFCGLPRLAAITPLILNSLLTRVWLQ